MIVGIMRMMMGVVGVVGVVDGLGWIDDDLTRLR